MILDKIFHYNTHLVGICDISSLMKYCIFFITGIAYSHEILHILLRRNHLVAGYLDVFLMEKTQWSLNLAQEAF